jgi:hypothetical protein
MDNKYITENPYITITEHGNNVYTLEADHIILNGYCKKLDDKRVEIKLNTSFSKETNRYHKKGAKLFNSSISWFGYMIEKYAKDFNN